MLTTSLGRPAGVLRLAVLAIGAVLVGCGGGGGGGGSSPGPSKVFVAATITSAPPAIGSIINPDPPAGELDVDRLIQAGSTGLAGTIGSLALDTQSDRLYVGNQAIVRVFNGASFADGGPSPARSFSFATGPAFNAASLFIDPAGNRLYLGDDLTSVVGVYDNASTLNNPVDATRTITGFDTVLGVQVDTVKDILYVTNKSPTSVYTIRVYNGASALTGPATPTHVITPHINTSDMPVGDLFVDAANDRLYVAGGTNTLVMVFEAASTKDGTTTPDKTLTFPIGAITALKTVIVANDRLFALGAGGVYLLNGVSSVSAGAVTGKAAIAPAGVSFTGIAVSP
jgi:hypothetical protein